MATYERELQRHRYGLGILRIVLGTVFVAHGAQKVFEFGFAGTAGGFEQMGLPLPAVSAGLVIAAELLGGLALIAGFLTRLAAVPLAVTMLVAMLVVHLPAGFFLPQGIEFTLVMLAGVTAVLVAGPGAWALDGVVRAGNPGTAADAAAGDGDARRLGRAA